MSVCVYRQMMVTTDDKVCCSSSLSFSSMASTSPRNFSWVEPGKLAGLALPRMTSEYQYLLDNGIQHLVCLCERKPPYWDTCPELKLHHINIVDFTPPSPSQIERFLSIVEEANSKGEVTTQISDSQLFSFTVNSKDSPRFSPA